MSYVTGILTVPAFTDTGTVGEYSIAGATYNNQSDVTGEGTAAIVPGFSLYVPASDTNTTFPIPGVTHRFKVTSVTIIDGSTVNLIVKWDEAGPFVDLPTNGSDCIITSVSALGYGFSVDSTLYPSLAPGMVSGMLNAEIVNITEFKSGAASVNSKQGSVVISAGSNVSIDASGPNIVITSTGADEGVYQ